MVVGHTKIPFTMATATSWSRFSPVPAAQEQRSMTSIPAKTLLLIAASPWARAPQRAASRPAGTAHSVGSISSMPPRPDAPDTNADIWKTDQGIALWKAAAADQGRRRAEQRRLMADLLPFAEDEPFLFVDLGAGTGAAARTILDRYPAAKAILAEFSPQMMDEGSRALAPYEGRYRYVEFDLARGEWPAAIPDSVAAVISSLCVHHLPDDRKRELFGEIFARLSPGGWYLNFDPESAEDPFFYAAWILANDRRDPAAAEKRANLTPELQEHYEYHFLHIIPLAPQVGFLRAAGFEAVDVYWKELDYVIYGGRRPV
jgi:tRNA (cmo5U34)-methyltransferase